MSDIDVHSTRFTRPRQRDHCPPALGRGLPLFHPRLFTHRLNALGEVPGFERLRDAGREVKRQTIENLDYATM